VHSAAAAAAAAAPVCIVQQQQQQKQQQKQHLCVQCSTYVPLRLLGLLHKNDENCTANIIFEIVSSFFSRRYRASVGNILWILWRRASAKVQY
jgi:hypothetical protein